MATTCWASTSSGVLGRCSASIWPASIRSTTTAVCTRSPRNFGKSTPRLTAPTWWPARPTRCSPEATEGGDSTCTTRSTAPMSMPSSRLLVATTAGRRPDFRSSSMVARCSLLTEPWWARASTAGAPRAAPDWAITCAGLRVSTAARGTASGAPTVSAPSAASTRSSQISLSRVVRRSASRRLLENTRVEVCSATRSTMRSSTCGQIEARCSCPAAAPLRSPVGWPSSAMSGTGTTTLRSHCLVEGGCTTSTGRPPAR